MNQPPSVTPKPAVPQQAAPATSKLAVAPLADLLQSLHSTETGLSASDAAAILQTVGSNRVETVKSKGLLAAFIGRFSNPLVLICPKLRHYHRHRVDVSDPRCGAGASGPERR